MTGQRGSKVNGSAVTDIGDGLAQAARPAVVGVLYGDGIGAEDVKCGCRAAFWSVLLKKAVLAITSKELPVWVAVKLKGRAVLAARVPVQVIALPV